MYICSCNTITDSDINTAIKAGAKKPKDIYTSCGCKVQCGQCVRAMADYIRKNQIDMQPLWECPADKGQVSFEKLPA